MTQPIYLEPRGSDHDGRGRRLLVAIVSSLVILTALAIVEAGVLAVLAVASSAMNHHGLGS